MTCPVCGFDQLPGPPEDYLICPSCGTEFGYDDFAETHEERQRRWIALRRRWLNQGARWFSRATPSPVDWNPYSQLLSTGLAHDTANEATEDSDQFVPMGTASA